MSALTPEPAYRGRRKRITALLAHDCITFAEIGRRVGVTRSRVQQMAASLGIEGRRRLESCTIKTIAEVLATAKANYMEKGCLLGRFLKECKQRSLPTVCVLTGYGGHIVSSRDVLVNDKRVRVRSTAFGGPKQETYAVLRPMPEKRLEPIDVVATELPDGRWHLMCPQEMPSRMTAFALNEPQGNRSTGAHADRHDYRQYIDRWEVFTEDRK